MEQKMDQWDYKNRLLNRFLSYVAISPEVDPSRTTFADSSQTQRLLSRKIVSDLHELNLLNVSVDMNGTIMATFPKNTSHRIPTIGFIASFDTIPDLPVTGENYGLIRDYPGGDIPLGPEGTALRLSPLEFPELENYSGHTLVVSDGRSVLGADGKAGIAEILTAVEYLQQQEDIKHGPIRLAFVPNGQLERGGAKFDIESFGADWAYSLQASAVGELQYESFNGAEARISIQGRKSHTGYARGQLINASRLAMEYLQLLPPDEIPELTSGDQGFFHLSMISGDVSRANLVLQIRDHNSGQFEARKKLLEHFTTRLNEEYPGALNIEVIHLFDNMHDKVQPHMHIVELAARTMVALGIKPLARPIRGGDLAVDLSQRGLPCIGLFTGGHNFHGPFEYISLESMEKAVQVISRVANLTERQHRL